METSKALERQVHRIHELLERSHDDVTWNDHIPDPDNPKQLRQIDITVRRDGRLTCIECRLSKKRQDVKWIEELIGRRQSLGAQTIMAVAPGGFTIGAKRKAARFGVRLRDLEQLSDEEIRSWGRQVKLIVYFYRYSDLNLSVGFASKNIPNLRPAILSRELRSHAVLQSVFNAAATQLDTLKLLARNDTRKFGFGIRIRPEKVCLCGIPILEIILEGKARLVAKPIVSPGVFRYGEPNQAGARRSVTVERFTPGETSIVHHQGRIAIDVDLASVRLPPLSQIRYFRATSAREQEHESFAVTNPGKLRVVGRLRVRTYILHA